MTDSKIYYWLSLCGLSDRKLNALLDLYSPQEVWESIEKNKHFDKILGEKACENLRELRSERLLDERLTAVKEQNIRIVTRASEKFPRKLLQREVCPPVLLYYRGDLSLVESNCVAIVGTRACSAYGKEVAETLSRELSNAGVTIVSGLATGIDGYAHAECLRSGGKTIAVLGGGLNNVTPVSNLKLAEEIEYSGLIVSQYPPSMLPTKYTFPERNRIISGLSLGTVVVEAGEKSGALITADFALEQGREVFAVPGNITSTRSKGTNALIKQGAHPVLSADDILSELSLNIHRAEKSAVAPLDFFEEKIYNLLIDEDKTLEDIIELSGLSAAETSTTLLSMEIKGIIKRFANVYGIR